MKNKNSFYFKKAFLIGLAFMSISAFWQLYDSTVSLILKNNYDLGETVTGFIMSLDNILAVFLLPLFGALSDKTKTRFGKRTPYIVFGTAAAVFSMMLLPYISMRFGITVFISALGFVLLAMSTYRSPAVALMPDLTPKPLRSKANAVINFMGALGAIYTLACIHFLVPALQNGERFDYTSVFACVAGLMAASVFVLVLTVRENKLALAEESPELPEQKSKSEPMPREVKKSLTMLLLSVLFWFMAYNAVTSTYSRYFEVVLGESGGGFAKSMMVGTIAAVISFFPVGLFADKLNRKRVVLAGAGLLTVAFAAASFVREHNAFMYVVLALTGLGWAAINVNSYPMAVEMAKSSDIGKYTGLYYTFSMAAQVVTPILSGAIIEYGPWGYYSLFPYAAFFAGLSFVTMLFVKHGNAEKTQKERT